MSVLVGRVGCQASGEMMWQQAATVLRLQLLISGKLPPLLLKRHASAPLLCSSMHYIQSVLADLPVLSTNPFIIMERKSK